MAAALPDLFDHRRVGGNGALVVWWPEEGLDHSRKMLAAELGYLDADFRRSVVTSDPARFARTVAEKTYYALFEYTRFVDALEWISRPPAAGEEGPRPKLHRLYRPIADFVIAAMQITQVFSVRLAILTLATPSSCSSRWSPL